MINDIQEQFRKPNNALVKIILINVLVYLIDCILYIIAQVSRTPSIFELVYVHQLLPSDWGTFLYHPWTIITYFFSHQIPSPLHTLFNMLGLYWFGYIVQDLIGSKKLISLYVLGGLAAGLVYMLVTNYIPYFQEHSSGTLVGASGSVLAVVVGAAAISPNYRFHLILIGPVKISYLAFVYVFLSFIGTVGSNAGGNVAHLGGAALGFLFVNQLRKGTDMGKVIFTPWNAFRGIFDKSARIKVSYKNQQGGGKSKELQQAEIDAILDKISRSGYESLSKEEKRKLFDASKQ